MGLKQRYARWWVLELIALSRIFTFHRRNSDFEKVLLWAVTLAWLALELGTTFSGYTPPESMWWIRLIVASAAARMLGLERALVEREVPPFVSNRHESVDESKQTQDSPADDTEDG